MKVAVVGAGNFGTAVANIVAANGVDVQLWMRDRAQLADIVAHGENRRYLPGHALADGVTPGNNLATAVGDSEMLFVTVPSTSFRAVANELRGLVRDGTFAISATKGIDADGFQLMSQILQAALPAAKVGVISGPNLAEEMADGRYTGTVVASRHESLCGAVQEVLKSPTFRVYASEDVYGVELGGALKNIYAIICGLASSLDVGQNAIAMLITRSLAEMGRFAVALGADHTPSWALPGLAICTPPAPRRCRGTSSWAPSWLRARLSTRPWPSSARPPRASTPCAWCAPRAPNSASTCRWLTA